jgi:hypothetical protein
MPLPLEKSVEIPNALLVPQIVLQTGISNGQLVTSAAITLMPCKVDINGKWSETGSACQTVYIPDVMKLDRDIEGLQKSVGNLFTELVGIIGQINSIRKVL